MSARRQRRLNAEINVVPYIDVMLVLLVVFMITAPLFSQGYQVDLPEAAAEPLEFTQITQVVISVSATGDYYYSSGESNDLLTFAQIENRLAALDQENISVFVRGDENVNYGAIITLMSLLREAGLEGVSLVTQPAPTQ